MTTDELIYSNYTNNQKPRKYLGWSQLGEKCERKLFYSFRNVKDPEFPPRILRLFQTGFREEDRVLDELRNKGVAITGEQDSCSSHKGHLKGHIDAIALDLPENPTLPTLVDVKTIKASKFKDLLRNGFKTTYPKYYAQGIGYMGNFNLKIALFIFVVKDTDEIHLEWFDFDEKIFKELNDKAERIIFDEALPPRISDTPSWYECKFCEMSKICHKKARINPNCRNCMFATPIKDGKWECEAAKEEIYTMVGCSDHFYHPMFFIEHSKAIEATKNGIIYESIKDYTQWTDIMGLDKCLS